MPLRHERITSAACFYLFADDDASVISEAPSMSQEPKHTQNIENIMHGSCRHSSKYIGTRMCAWEKHLSRNTFSITESGKYHRTSKHSSLRLTASRHEYQMPGGSTAKKFGVPANIHFPYFTFIPYTRKISIRQFGKCRSLFALPGLILSSYLSFEHDQCCKAHFQNRG